ncbi:MAG: transposase [Myxococcales bacterium]|nr:transposase [Myxococcales bacterium]
MSASGSSDVAANSFWEIPKTAKKLNETTAIPELLAILDLRGATVTIDAMGCQ